MKMETEIKLAIAGSKVKDIISKIEEGYNCKKSDPFHQTTHQFFLKDYTKQNVFPRIRNEKDGSISLTVKVKPKERSNFFKRIELETTISNSENVIAMMTYFGFPKKISWEKIRHSFIMNGDGDVCFYLDETPMGWFLEIEAKEEKIEEAITKLMLQKVKRISKAYLGLWDDYKKEHGIIGDDMMFDVQQLNPHIHPKLK